MWENIWPPRTPKPAWTFVGTVFVVCVLGLILAFIAKKLGYL